MKTGVSMSPWYPLRVKGLGIAGTLILSPLCRESIHILNLGQPILYFQLCYMRSASMKRNIVVHVQIYVYIYVYEEFSFQIKLLYFPLHDNYRLSFQTFGSYFRFFGPQKKNPQHILQFAVYASFIWNIYFHSIRFCRWLKSTTYMYIYTYLLNNDVLNIKLSTSADADVGLKIWHPWLINFHIIFYSVFFKPF